MESSPRHRRPHDQRRQQVRQLKEAFDQISAELRSQIQHRLYSTNTKLDGTYRKLEIKNKQGYKIQTRPATTATAREPLPAVAGRPTFESGGCCPCFRCKTSLPLPFRTKTLGYVRWMNPRFAMPSEKVSPFFPPFLSATVTARCGFFISRHSAPCSRRGPPAGSHSPGRRLIDSNENRSAPGQAAAGCHFRRHSSRRALPRQSHPKTWSTNFANSRPQPGLRTHLSWLQPPLRFAVVAFIAAEKAMSLPIPATKAGMFALRPRKPAGQSSAYENLRA